MESLGAQRCKNRGRQGVNGGDTAEFGGKEVREKTLTACEREKKEGSVLHLSADSCLPCEARPAPGRSSCFSHTPHRQ